MQLELPENCPGLDPCCMRTNNMDTEKDQLTGGDETNQAPGNFLAEMKRGWRPAVVQPGTG